MKIVLASSNKHKVKEINAIVQNYCDMSGGNIFKEIGGVEFILPPEGFDPVESGKNFDENSLIKAYAAWQLGKTWALADDSGLCIDALNGAPGIYSARYAESPQARIDRVLSEMQGLENRSAKFKCCMTLINPEGNVVFSYTGICRGSIVEEQRGVNGFGYDPIFLLDGSDKTMAELSEDEKISISHRGKALNAVLEWLRKLES